MIKKTFLSLFLLFAFLIAFEAKAGVEHNTYGEAWSENIGWISFNSTTGGGTINYGVNIADDGTITGQAWSENIGWVDFSNTKGICPMNYARVDLGTCDDDSCQVSGYAEWQDGCIGLRGTNYGVGITQGLSPNYFTGQAFGDLVVGWINFDGGDIYRVYTTFEANYRPRIDNLIIVDDEPDYCTGILGLGIVNIEWDYSDGDGDPQASYTLEVFRNGVQYFIIESPQSVPSGEKGSAMIKIVENPVNDFEVPYGADYTFRVKVKDDHGKESSFVNGPPFTAIAHFCPFPDFEVVSPRVQEDKAIRFSNESICYGGFENCNYSWDFGDGTALDSNDQFVLHTFSDPGDHNVTLTAIDRNLGMSCYNQKELTVQKLLPPPKWIEVIPF